MVTAALVTVAIALRTARSSPSTTAGRSIGALWMAGGIALFVYGFCVANTWQGSVPVLVGGVEVILGLINLASGLILCWQLQQFCGYLWTAFAAVSFFVPERIAGYLFLAAIFLCNILFGLILMISETRTRSAIPASGTTHA